MIHRMVHGDEAPPLSWEGELQIIHDLHWYCQHCQLYEGIRDTRDRIGIEGMQRHEQYYHAEVYMWELFQEHTITRCYERGDNLP